MEKPERYVERARDLEVYKRAYAVFLEVHSRSIASLE